MLAQSFKTAEDLGITEPQKDALIKTLVLLETGKLRHVKDDAMEPPGMKVGERKFTGHFNMGIWGVDPCGCGTVACIGGTAELIAGKPIFNEGFMSVMTPLANLFYPSGDWNEITTAQAATALRSYLTTGDAKWSEALAARSCE